MATAANEARITIDVVTSQGRSLGRYSCTASELIEACRRYHDGRLSIADLLATHELMSYEVSTNTLLVMYASEVIAFT